MKKKSVCLAVLLFGLLVMSLWVTKGYGYQEASAATKGTVTTNGLRVRTEAGTNKEVLTHNGANVALTKGTSITIKSEKTVGEVTWYKVSFTYQGEKLTGYVSGDYVKIVETEAESGESTDKTESEKTESTETTKNKKVTISKGLSVPAKITASSVNVRKGASTDNSKLTVNGKNVSLKKGAGVKIIKEVMNKGQKWYYISFTYNKVTQKGYVLSDYVQLVLTREISAYVYGAEKVKLRTGASKEKSYKKVNGKTLTLKEGAEMLIIKESKDKDGAKWYKVECAYDGKLTKGFIPANNVVLSKVVPIRGEVTTNNLRVRTGAGTNYGQLVKGDQKVLLQQGQMVTVSAQTKVGDVTWYKVSFDYKDDTVSGYISGDYVELVKYTLDLGVPEEETPVETPSDSEGNTNGTGEENTDGENTGDETTDGNENQEDTNTETTVPSGEVITDIESFLAEQRFPESYKEGLRALHAAHPTWVFKAYHTGLTWEDVVNNESKVGLNLISNNKANGWKSYEEKAYKYETDKFVVYDGSIWVTASKDAVAYYMDPRNFMTERGMFQFLTLEYQSGYENTAGVEKILANTPLYNTTYSYFDEMQMMDVTKTYSETFMEAAAKSGVSPYHLATRVKQEVVTNSTSLSGSATGTFAGYEGYYNFYNIGATHSTEAGGAIANGLNFAMGNKSSESAKFDYWLPWDNQYDAIVGGAAYIGSQYINRGQNTIYLQKFNVTPNSTYTHQYMANVEAANSEAIKLYNGYTSVLNTSLVFYIPVYENMPEEKTAVPGSIPSPNNWLKSLTVDSYELTPAFDRSLGSSQNYVLSLELEEVTTVNLEAVAANNKASIMINQISNGSVMTVSGTGYAALNLVPGLNEIEIMVTAENGAMNTYRLTIMK